MSDGTIFKALTAVDWREANVCGLAHAPIDAADGYVHLSTRAQVAETLALHFRGEAGVRLVAFRIPDLEAQLRWEPSRGGDLFPHYYGELKLSRSVQSWQLEQDAEGIPVLPGDL